MMRRNFKKPKNVIFAIKNIPIRDHCHITGKYRGSAHQNCNLKLKVNTEKIKIPVIFHNLRGYDSYFIMQEIGAIVEKNTHKNKKGEEKQMNINAIPNNTVKYMAFMLGNNLVFLDSFQFMSSGLEKLVSNLPRKSLKYTSQKFKDKKLDLMARKGVYRWMTEKQIDKIDLAKYKEDSEKGLILEVDLEYPEELHDLHNDYPLEPEKVRVSNDMLSEYCKNISEKYINRFSE